MTLSTRLGAGVREQFFDTLGVRRRNQIGYGPPSGFDAYARILHPMDPGDRTMTATMRWAEVAQRFGCPIASGTTWDQLRRCIADASEVAGVTWDTDPVVSSLPLVHTEALVEVLSEATAAHACSFGVWCGFADLDPFVREATMIDVASRETYLFEGDLSDATTNLYDRGGVVRGHRGMNVWLPPGASWMVSTELYATNTLVAASEEIIAAIERVPELEVLRVSATDVHAVI